MSLRRRMEDDLHRDIRDHIEGEIRENVERGMSPEEARGAALRRFGNTLRVTEETHAVWHWRWAERLRQDVRYAVRALHRNPMFAAAAVLTLALSLGMNTAVFSVVNAVLIEPLQYPHPERLVWIANYNDTFKMEAVAGPDFVDWREQAQSFDKMACYGYSDQTIAYGGYADQATVADVTEDFWPMSGVRPAAGHLFSDAEPNTIVLTHALWERRFGADPAVVGKTVLLEGRPVTVVGILPKGFRLLFPTPQRPDIQPKSIDAYVPAGITRQTQVRGRNNAIVNVVARMKPGVTLELARGEVEGIQARIAQQNPNGFYKLVKLRVMPLGERLVGNARQALLVLLGAVAFVLLIACANIASLLLARAAGRRREVAIRAAVGAGQRRMIAQFLMEGLVLAFAGGAAGLLLARWAITMLVAFGSRAVPRLEDAAIDARVLAFTLAVSILSGVLFGLGPAISLARTNLHEQLKEGGKLPTSGSRPRLRTLLVAGELAMALVLLMGAGLMLKSLWRMSARPPGFHPESTLVMRAALSGPAYRDMPQQLAYFEEVLRRLANAPGVVAAGTFYAPVRGFVAIEGMPPLPPGQGHQAIYCSTSAGYFGAMGIRLIEGRWMRDHEPSEVVLVNQAFVRQVLGGASPLGKRVRVPRPPEGRYVPIVGVVSEVKYSKLDAEPGPEVYFPYTQSIFVRAADVVVRVSGDPAAVAPGVRKLISDIDRSQPVFDVQTLEHALATSVAPRRFNLLLLGVFAGAALLLAVIGVYGVMSYSVSERTHEVGVRMALGARRGEIVRMVVRQGMALALAGLTAGSAAALGLTRLMAGLLVDVKPNDAWTFATVTGVLAATALSACAIPAFRAARIDPSTALRYQ